MPFATRKKANTDQSATLKPCVSPYHGTRIAAAAKVSVNIRTLAQTIGACVGGTGSGIRFADPWVGDRRRAQWGRGAQWGLRARPQEGRRNLARLPERCGAAVVVFEYAAAPETPFAGWRMRMRTVTRFRAFRRRGARRHLIPGTAVLLAGAWLALAPAAGAARAYVSNEDDGTVTVVDTQRLTVLATLPVGKRPRGLALSHDRTRLYVALSGLPKCPPPMTDEDCARLPRDPQADGIAVIDAATLRPLGVLRGVSDPERVALSRNDRTLYVSEEDAGRLAVLDVARASVLATVAVGREPEGVRASADGRWVLVTSEEENTLAVIDARKHTLVTRVKVGKRPRDIAITPDSRIAYVSGEAD